MAKLDKDIDIDVQWKEISALVPMTNGESYVTSIYRRGDHTTVYSCETDSTDTPDSSPGHPWFRIDDLREYTKENGVYLWVRCDRGTATIVVKEI